MKRLLGPLGIILLLALTVRVLFGAMVVSQHSHATFTGIHGDIGGYIQLGERMKARVPYTASSVVHRDRGLVRPPGYPAFYAFWKTVYAAYLLDIGLDARLLVWPQIVISLGQVAATYALAYVALRRRSAAILAGSLAAISPTGVATAAIAMPDSTYATCFALAFLGFVLAIRGRPPADPCPPAHPPIAPPAFSSLWFRQVFFRPAVAKQPSVDTPALSGEALRETRRVYYNHISLAGLALALAALLKPAAIYWPVLAIPLLLFHRGVRFTALGDVRRLFLPLVIVVLVWTKYNAMGEGVWAYSTVSARNLRYAVATKVELGAQLGRLPTHAEYVSYASQFTARDAAFLRSNKAKAAAYFDRITEETRSIFRAHPVMTARVLAANLRSQLTTRYKMIHRQLPGRSKPSAKLREFYDWTDTRPALAMWYGLMLAALPLCLWLRDRAGRAPLIACWAGFLYVALPLGSVGEEGSRLLLSAEPMMLTLIAASLAYLGAEANRRWSARRR